MGNDPELNVAFAEAMEPLYRKYSGNLDVAAIYVEALMNSESMATLGQECRYR